MPATIQDFVLTGAGKAGQYVQLRSNVTGVVYTSAAPTDSNGSFQLVAALPPGFYKLYTSPSLVAPVWTLYDAFYWVPPDIGDSFLLGSVKPALGVLGLRADITHPNYGGIADARRVTDAGITATLTVVTSNTFAFTAADVGKAIAILGAGAAGVPLQTTIASVQSATSATLNVAAQTTVANAKAILGTDNGPALRTAYTALLNAGGGTIGGPPGNYLVVGGATFNSPLVGWDFGSSAIAVLFYVGAGDCMRVQMNPFSNVLQHTGPYLSIHIDGTYAQPGAAGIHYGDTVGGLINDWWVTGFLGGVNTAPTTASKGVWFDNRTNWTELTWAGQIEVQNCTIDILFDVNGTGTTSFDHNQFTEIKLGVGSAVNAGTIACTGIHMRNAAVLALGSIMVTGNCDNVSTVLRITDTAALGFVHVEEFMLFSVESGGVGAIGINMDATAQICGIGILDFGTGSFNNIDPGFASANIQFAGKFDCPGIYTPTANEPFQIFDKLGTRPGGIGLQIVGGGVSLIGSSSGGNTLATDGSNTYIRSAANPGSIFIQPRNGSATGQSQFDTGGNLQSYSRLYPGDQAGAQQTSGGLLHSTGVPSNANGNNNDWCISDNGHLYLKRSGVWQDVIAAIRSMSTPANPAGTISAAQVMMGLAGAITPNVTGTIEVTVSGDMLQATAGDGVQAQVSFGTGTAPVNGAALAGTQVGAKPKLTNTPSATFTAPFSITVQITGLPLGVAVWLDIALNALVGGAGHTASIENVTIAAKEI